MSSVMLVPVMRRQTPPESAHSEPVCNHVIVGDWSATAAAPVDAAHAAPMRGGRERRPGKRP